MIPALVIVVAVLREIGSREPQCIAAVAAGVLALLLAMRSRMRFAARVVALRTMLGGGGTQHVTPAVRINCEPSQPA